MVKRVFYFFSFLSLMFSCTPEDGIDGRDGINGQDGVDGQDGFSIGLVSTELGNGCRELNFFRDSNNNGVQESNESSITTFEVCSGLTPNIAMVSQNDTNCPNGGKIFTFFNDLNDDGELDANEDVLGSDSICNGEDGADGIDGNAAGTFSIYVKETSSISCSNGGFDVSVFGDLNANGLYDPNSETLLNTTTICFPSTESIEYPDYSALGHTYDLIGVWRSYSALGIPIPEANRFNIYFYPDSANPEKLVNTKSNQTGWLEFPVGSTPIGWSNRIQASPRRDEISFDFNKIEGVNIGELQTFTNKNKIIFNIGDNTSYTQNVTISIPVGVDTNKWVNGLRSIVFYKVQ